MLFFFALGVWFLKPRPTATPVTGINQRCRRVVVPSRQQQLMTECRYDFVRLNNIRNQNCMQQVFTHIKEIYIHISNV